MDNKSNQTFLEKFLHSQTSGSIMLMMATLIAVLWANSGWSRIYYEIEHLQVGVVFAGNTYQLGLAHLVKDGLMSVFFFVVGLEIKREVVIGELSSFRKAALPALAAVGGSIVPAIIYFCFNRHGEAAAGWGIPMATDIAFALGILALLGSRVPSGLKVFLAALAIVDDLLAVLVIAIFYTEKINFVTLLVGGFFLLQFYLVVKFHSRRPGLYLAPAIGVWACFMMSGVHATTAGVVIALLIPVKSRIDPKDFIEKVKNNLESILKTGNFTRESVALDKMQWNLVEGIYLAAEDMLPSSTYLEKYFHPFTAFVVLPLFALFAAGISLSNDAIAAFPNSVSLGIILGLLLGKQIGITLACLAAVKSGLADLPKGVNWSGIWGVSILSGIGFTISIFISELGFKSEVMINDAKIGIFVASLLAGIIGYLVLRMKLPKTESV